MKVYRDTVVLLRTLRATGREKSDYAQFLIASILPRSNDVSRLGSRTSTCGPGPTMDPFRRPGTNTSCRHPGAYPAQRDGSCVLPFVSALAQHPPRPQRRGHRAPQRGPATWWSLKKRRKLNNVTYKDCYPLPNIADCLDAFKGSSWFAILDLRSSFYQVPLAQADRNKTAFITRRGQWRFCALPMELSNFPATLQRLMDLVLCGLTAVDSPRTHRGVSPSLYRRHCGLRAYFRRPQDEVGRSVYATSRSKPETETRSNCSN